MKIDYLLQSLGFIAQELSAFEALLNNSRKSRIRENLKSLSLEPIRDAIQRIKTIQAEFLRIKSIILIDQDFTNLCLLITHGWDMVEYLLDRKGIPESIHCHARAWKKIVVEFKPFLKNSIYYQDKIFR